MVVKKKVAAKKIAKKKTTKKVVAKKATKKKVAKKATKKLSASKLKKATGGKTITVKLPRTRKVSDKRGVYTYKRVIVPVEFELPDVE